MHGTTMGTEMTSSKYFRCVQTLRLFRALGANNDERYRPNVTSVFGANAVILWVK